MRTLIADDEIYLAQDLQQRLRQAWPELEIVAICHDGVAAERALRELQPDLAFLDIRMPGQNGLDAAQHAPAHCRVVFVTAFDDYAIQAFEQAAIDYLLKPVSDDRLAKCIQRLRQPAVKPSAPIPDLLPKSEKLHWLRVSNGSNVQLLPVDDVCYFQANDKYTSVFTHHNEHLVRTPIKELIEQLDSQQFWQIHRSTIVNVKQILRVQHDLLGKTKLSLRNRSEQLVVSRRYVHLFRQM